MKTNDEANSNPAARTTTFSARNAHSTGIGTPLGGEVDTPLPVMRDKNVTTRPLRGRKRGKPVAVVKHGSTSVPVYKGTDRGHTRFTIAFYQDGLRQRRNFVSLDKAKEEARLAALNIQRGLSCDNELWIQDREALAATRRMLDPFGMSLFTAVHDYVQCRRKLGDVPLMTCVDDYLRRAQSFTPGVRVARVIDEFVAAKAQDRISERYLRLIRETLKRFGEWFQEAIAPITTQQLDQWVRRGDHSIVTRKGWITLIKEFFGFARRQGYLPRLEPTAAEALKAGRRGETEVGIFKPEDMEKLLRAAEADTLAILAFGGFAGLRVAEIERLDWSAVDLNRKIIELRATQTKTASRRIIPISENLAAWLSTLQRQGPVMPDHEALRRMRALARRTNINWPHNALRHSYISYRIAVVQNVAQVALEAGNSPTIIFKHYRELVTKEEAEKWFAIMPA